MLSVSLSLPLSDNNECMYRPHIPHEKALDYTANSKLV